MILSLILASLVASVPAASDADKPPTTDIVVVAKKRKCRVQLRGALLSDRELTGYAAQWAKGEHIKVHVPSNARYKCLAEIMFRLQEHGVTRAEFVDERTAP